MTLESMKEKLGLEPILTQIPIGSDIIDLINFEKITFDSNSMGCEITRMFIEADDTMLQKRQQMIEKIGEFDDSIGELVINEEEVKNEDIKAALRNIVLDSKALVTFCGSAYKNYGVQPLMDSIIEYLPNPLNTNHRPFLKNLRLNKDLCAMAFKIINHPTKGKLDLVKCS